MGNNYRLVMKGDRFVLLDCPDSDNWFYMVCQIVLRHESIDFIFGLFDSEEKAVSLKDLIKSEKDDDYFKRCRVDIIRIPLNESNFIPVLDK